MYLFIGSEHVPGPKSPFRVGYPENTAPNLCLLSSHNTSAYVTLNAQVLREALINSPNVMKTLGLKVVDLNAIPKEEPKPKPKLKPAPKKETKVEEPEAPKETPKEEKKAPKESQGKDGDDGWS